MTVDHWAAASEHGWNNDKNNEGICCVIWLVKAKDDAVWEAKWFRVNYLMVRFATIK